MGQDTHGVNKNKIFSLSNYSLTYQLFFINLLASFIGFIFLIIFNYYLIQNDRNILLDYDNAFIQTDKITNFLMTSAIMRVPRFNENCQNIKDNSDCKKISSISEPGLDPTSTQQFILQNFLKSNIGVKVYNDNKIIFADTNYMDFSTGVTEIDINAKMKESINFVDKYRIFYMDFFNKHQKNFIQNKFLGNSKKIWSENNEINFVSETIYNKKILSKKIHNKEKEIIQIIVAPIINNEKVFGVVIVSYPLISNNFNLGLTSFNLFNFYALFVLIMLSLSFFFSQSLVSPIKLLSRLTITEREKIKQKNEVEYPIRGDEIGTLSKEIQNMSSDLKSQINQLEKFAADVSHELKNPLTSLQSANELIVNDKISGKDKKLLIDNMSKDIKRMNRLISDIANYTKIKAEIEIENFEYIKILDLLKDIVEQYNGNKKNIKIEIEDIEIERDENIRSVLANRNKLSQVFYNLIDNSISILDKDKKILISLEKKDDQHIYIKIYDQGKGIPIELAEKVFDRFYTDRDVDRNNHTGLGLSIVSEIIRSFKGSVQIIKSDRTEYSGACFLIKLPLKNDKKK